MPDSDKNTKVNIFKGEYHAYHTYMSSGCMVERTKCLILTPENDVCILSPTKSQCLFHLTRTSVVP